MNTHKAVKMVAQESESAQRVETNIVRVIFDNEDELRITIYQGELRLSAKDGTVVVLPWGSNVIKMVLEG